MKQTLSKITKALSALALSFVLILGDVNGFAPISTVQVEAATKAVSVKTAAQLKEALAKGGKYKLAKSIKIKTSLTVKKGVKVNLYLQGKTIYGTNNNSPIIVVDGGTLAIRNTSSKIGAITNKGSQAAIGCKSGKLNIYSGNITGGEYAVYKTGGTFNNLGGVLVARDEKTEDDTNEILKSNGAEDFTYKPGEVIKDEDMLHSVFISAVLNLKPEVKLTVVDGLPEVLQEKTVDWLEEIEQSVYEGTRTAVNWTKINNDPWNGDLVIDYGEETEMAIAIKYPEKRPLTSSAIQKYYSQMQDIISTCIKSGMTDKEKVIALHDYLIDNYDYDYSFAENSYSFHAQLDNGKGVCQAYSLLMRYLCLMCGIECESISGVGTDGPGYDKSSGGAHMWNRVKIDGTWYCFDVTYDDGYSPAGLEHYFMLNSSNNLMTEKEFYGMHFHYPDK